MNPFASPDTIFISCCPQDMRAGIQKLCAVVVSEFGRQPTDGALYCFVSRDCKKMKMLRFEISGWCLYYLTLSKDRFRWCHKQGGQMLLQIERRQLMWLCEGLDWQNIAAPKPLTSTYVI